MFFFILNSLTKRLIKMAFIFSNYKIFSVNVSPWVQLLHNFTMPVFCMIWYYVSIICTTVLMLQWLISLEAHHCRFCCFRKQQQPHTPTFQRSLLVIYIISFRFNLKGSTTLLRIRFQVTFLHTIMVLTWRCERQNRYWFSNGNFTREIKCWFFWFTFEIIFSLQMNAIKKFSRLYFCLVTKAS